MSTLLCDDLKVCTCCLFAHANGDSCDCPDGHAERVTAAFERLAVEGCHVACNDKEGEEPAFSWAACDVCGSRLGGDRHTFALFKTEEK